MEEYEIYPRPVGNAPETDKREGDELAEGRLKSISIIIPLCIRESNEDIAVYSKEEGWTRRTVQGVDQEDNLLDLTSELVR